MPSAVTATETTATMTIGTTTIGGIRRWVTAPQMTMLFTDLSFEDSSAIIKDLERQGIPYDMRNDGATVMVPKELVPRWQSTTWPLQAPAVVHWPPSIRLPVTPVVRGAPSR